MTMSPLTVNPSLIAKRTSTFYSLADATAARLSGACTNGDNGILLGHDPNNNEVWASLIKNNEGLFAYDAVDYRAII
ncbi:hypothetical protein K504DRAFT_508924 [Pleomassaria siparia CBS 279.74]|uniref:Uncharacterized protein n=1 Tax=Pleomassaria siparia CBS 279.74 TaxID=1314801 RepID=A0A6G1JQW8_9PLEO|nr:hypothetical protein K504DRAFT_508924 [Pleomassaria siparia CBS 279.74]